MEETKETNKFIYQKGDIEIKICQCDFCKYNDINNENICVKYPDGKPQDIKDTKKEMRIFRL